MIAAAAPLQALPGKSILDAAAAVAMLAPAGAAVPAWVASSDFDDTHSSSEPPSPVCSGTNSSPPSCEVPCMPAAAAVAAAVAAATAPAVPPASAATAAKPAGYSAASYWDNRYASDRRGIHFDWFLSYKALSPLLRHALPPGHLPVMHVGCGNSDLSTGLCEDGTPVVNTDISPVVIEQMRQDAAALPPGALRAEVSWEVADCRSMPQYGDGSFSGVLDKGTLDAVLCSGSGLVDARAYVSEAYRLLAPGGAFLLISLGAPDSRLSVLRAQPRRRRPSSADAAVPAWPGSAPASLSARLAFRFAAAADAAADAADAAAAAAGGAGRQEIRWARVSVYLLPKPSAYLANEASLIGRSIAPGASPRAQVEKDEPALWLGPYEVGAELEAALAAVDARDYFFAYACVRAAAAHTRRPSGPARDGAAPAAAAGPAAAAASRLGGPQASFSGDAPLAQPPPDVLRIG
ncbi:hypothetical protein Rsub_02792 [Raphidocelis subcapitata]|uniref:Methyltransferase type 11 domain-containing protein n=1 Tax=Raphidocelis subcapitata TaxID=307507 RepID=A0A2V0NR17_9CHLO|nr:hypothetical protein Rsub_02792 [Raphidocelis subcapitata]|eukprot:GBF90084.1 hypothetical protein Rsub_02792 [Raphidocelis subcapitata]